MAAKLGMPSGANVLAKYQVSASAPNPHPRSAGTESRGCGCTADAGTVDMNPPPLETVCLQTCPNSRRKRQPDRGSSWRELLSRGLDEPLFEGIRDQFGAARGPDLAHDSQAVVLDRPRVRAISRRSRGSRGRWRRGSISCSRCESRFPAFLDLASFASRAPSAGLTYRPPPATSWTPAMSSLLDGVLDDISVGARGDAWCA